MHIVRVIWGEDIFLKTGFLNEFNAGNVSLAKYCKFPVVYYVYGRDNLEELLKRIPDAQYWLLSEDALPFAPKYNHWYHKVWAIKEAQQHHGEILYLDFDACFIHEFTDELYSSLKQKGNSFPWYLPSRKCCIKYREGEYKNRIPCNGFLYFTSNIIIDEWVKSYSILNRSSDEQCLAHACENIHGIISLEEFQKIYEPNILQNIKQPKKDLKNICVLHPYHKFPGNP